MQPVRFSIFHVILWLGLSSGLVVGVSYGYHYFGIPGAILGGLIGFCVGGCLGQFPDQWLMNSLFREIENSSTDELWSIVKEPYWNFRQTLALLHLSARGEDIEAQQSRIILMLKSDEVLHRRFGWDALRLVYSDLAGQIEDYNPRDSHEKCLFKTRRLEISL